MPDGSGCAVADLGEASATALCPRRGRLGQAPTHAEAGRFSSRTLEWGEFPYVSTYNSDFAFDFGLAMTDEQVEEIPEVKESGWSKKRKLPTEVTGPTAIRSSYETRPLRVLSMLSRRTRER